MEKPNITRPEPANIREVWPGEASDFTPWLADNLDWLDLLGLGPLSVVGIETTLAGTGRSLDILAETPDGHRVAIENQYGQADHDHLTRGLAYAIGLDTKALVVIAEGHRPEFIAIADYLNTAYEQMTEDARVAVFLVELTVEKVGDAFIPRFTVLSSPNEWRSQVSAAHRDTIGSVEEFLETSIPDARDSYATLIQRWEQRPLTSLRRGGTTVSLWYLLEGPPRRLRSFFTLEPGGVVWINRDFCREITGFDDDKLNALLTETVPGATVVGKGGWGKVTCPGADQLLAFADEVIAGGAQA